MSWIIYKHTNTLNGKVYIGQTKQNPKYRWGPDGSKYTEQCTKFYRAIQKAKRIDPDAWNTIFLHEIIEEGIQSQNVADEREIYWIQYYDSYLNGYNMTRGGHDGEYVGKAVFQIDPLSLKIVKKFSSSSEASRSFGSALSSSINACCHGKQVTAFNYYWCFEDNYFPGWYPRSFKNIRPILQIDKESLRVVQEFNSLNSAEKQFKSKNIANCCRRKSIEACGYYWCYSSDYSDDWVPPKHKHKKRVIQTDESLTIVSIYDSIRDAAKATNASENSISKCCSYQYIKAKGYYWCFESNYDSFTPLIPKENHTNAKTVCQIDKNSLSCIAEYKSIPEASKKTGCSADSIGRCCRREDIIETGGYYWCYIDDLSTFIPKRRKKRSDVYTEEVKKKISEKNGKKVMCIELNKVFNSALQVKKTLNIDNSSVQRACTGIQKTAGGYHWKYVD